MYGTSFAENLIAFYLAKVTEVEQQKKFGRWRYDIYLPKFNTVIEYDGGYFHRNRVSVDNNKGDYLCQKGIELIRINEDRREKNYVDGNTIYIKDNHFTKSRFQFAVDSLFAILHLPHIEVDWVGDYDKILALSAKSQVNKKLVQVAPELLKEWDYEKNVIKPEDVSACSHYDVYWKCSKGHSYKLSPALRTKQHQNCPYCASKRILKGFNDLPSLYPDVVKEWNYEKNGDLNPDDFMASSNKKVWWKCSKCGHEWSAKICNRTLLNRGCYKCYRTSKKGKKPPYMGDEDKVTIKFRESEYYQKSYAWDLNVGIDPYKIKWNSHVKVFWRCPDCGRVTKTDFYGHVIKGTKCRCASSWSKKVK